MFEKIKVFHVQRKFVEILSDLQILNFNENFPNFPMKNENFNFPSIFQLENYFQIKLFTWFFIFLSKKFDSENLKDSCNSEIVGFFSPFRKQLVGNIFLVCLRLLTRSDDNLWKISETFFIFFCVIVKQRFLRREQCSEKSNIL